MRQKTNFTNCNVAQFQSTHPVRGATTPRNSDNYDEIFQSTHPVRGATRVPSATQTGVAFQSTHPVRGATYCFVEITRYREISIHAPREGCDRRTYGLSCRNAISIHAPREGCDACNTRLHDDDVKFQSTHPVRGATREHHAIPVRPHISIHAPREGCD